MSSELDFRRPCGGTASSRNRENLKAIELDALLERHRLTVQAKIERYGAELKRVAEELQKRDLAEVPIPKLYDIMLKLHARVEEACPALTVRGDDEIADQKALRELVDSRRTRKASATTAYAGRQGKRDGTVGADDLVTAQLSTLQRFRAGEIGEHAAGRCSRKATLLSKQDGCWREY